MDIFGMTQKGPLFRRLSPLWLIVLFGLTVYSNTFTVPFQFDDTANIVENPLIQNTQYLTEPSRYCSRFSAPVSQSTICKFFKTRYVGYLTFALNFAGHGLNVAEYHVVNLLVHIINAVLVYFLVIATFQTPAFKRAAGGGMHTMILALGAALFFVVHPVQTQAVTYIVQRFTSLATMFYLLSLVTYVKWRLEQQTKEQRRRTTEGRQQTTDMRRRLKPVFWYAVSLTSAVLAMKTKEIAFTLPVVLVVYEFLFFEGAVKKRLLLLAPFFLTLLIIPVSLVGTGGPIGSMIGDMSESTRLLTPMSRWAYLFTEFRVIATYLRLIFLPVNQNLDYDYPLYPSFMHGEVLLSFLLLAAIIGLGIYCYRRSKTGDARLRFVSFGIFWFFTTLSVESSVIPIVDVIFEHRVYLPSVGAFIAISALLAVLWGRMEREGALIKTVVMTVPVVIIIVLAGATYARNAVWQDKAGLWEDVVRKSPNKARAYRNLAYYVADTDSARAMELYAQALMLDPLNAHAYNNRGLLLYKAKRYEEAVDDLSKAIVVDPNFAAAYNNRGIVRYGTGSLEQALDDFSTAIRLNPFYADAYSNRGSTYGNKGDLDKALEDFSAAISLSPEKDGYYVNRAIAYSRSGRVNEALADYRKACALGNAMACEYLENRPKQQE